MVLFTKGRDFAELLLIVEPLNGGWDLIVYKGKYVSKNFPKILFSATWVLRGFWGFHVKFILVRYGSAWTAPPSPNRYVRAVVIFAVPCMPLKIWRLRACGSDFLFAVQPQNRKILVQKSEKTASNFHLGDFCSGVGKKSPVRSIFCRSSIWAQKLSAVLICVPNCTILPFLPAL